MAERRTEGVRLLEAGEKSQVQIAGEPGVSAAAVSVWAKELKEKGPEALEARKASGRPARLVAGFPTEQWTKARVKKAIEQEFGVVYHQDYISRLLDSMGWNVQKPDPRAMEHDEEMILAWLKRDWPRIKKGITVRRRNRV